MSNGDCGIKIIAVINPCLYGISYPGSRGHSIAGLYGIVPPELNAVDNIHTKELLLILEQWRNFNSSIKDFISSSEGVEFKQDYIVDGVPFGKFTLINSTESRFDLKDYLLQTTIGVISNNPLKDAFIIKSNSFKPGDFNLSLSSSDESSTSSVENRRKQRTRTSCLKKPQALPSSKSVVSSSEESQPTSSGVTFTAQDQAIVNAVLKNKTLPSEFLQRLSFPRAGIPTSTCNTPQLESQSKQVEKKAKPFNKEIKLDEYLTKGENEGVENYHEVEREWIKSLAYKHAGIVEEPSTENQAMASSKISSNPPPTSLGRGRLFAMAKNNLQEKLCIVNENSSEMSSAPAGGMGRGQYLKSFSGKSRGSGRGQLLHQIYNQIESTPPPGSLKRVFSYNTFGSTLNDTYQNSEATENKDSSSTIYRNDNLDESSSSTSVESVKTSVENSFTSQLAENNTSDSSVSLANELNDRFYPAISSDCQLDDYLEKILAFGGLIHGKGALPPIKRIVDSNINSLVIEGIKKYIVDIQRTLAYAIPNVLQRRNVTIISTSKSGKTLAAIIPLIGLLCETEFYSSLKMGCGPKAVYITSCAQTVTNVAREIEKFAPHLTVINTYGGGNELEKMEYLANGCDVLVSTPRCWLRLLKCKWVTSVNRLCHLYIDDMDIMINLYRPELMEILKLFDYLKSSRADRGPEPQLVLIGETWNPIISEIVTTRITDPMLCFTSFLEASLYTHIKPTVHVISHEKKVDKLLDLLEGKKVPSIIICNNSEEVCFLRGIIYGRWSNLLCAHGNMIFTLKRDTHLNWKNLRMSKVAPPLLITSDDALVDLGITDAQWLLHYSLPISKTSFDYRFSTVKSNFIDRLSNPEAPLNPDCYVDILLDHETEQQLSDIVSFMTRLKASIPQELHNAVEKINKKKEAVKSSEVGLCENLLQFGDCWKKVKCKQQHCINYDRDKPKSVPLSGYLRVKVLKVHSPTHFSVRLIAHTEDPKVSPECWTAIPSSYLDVTMYLNRYYSERKNRKMHGSVQVGDFAGVEVDIDTNYHRVKILQITERDTHYNAVRVRVHFLDEGTIADIKAFKLLYLPNELIAYPRSSLDMYLTGLLPVDLDRHWSFSSTNLVKKKLASLPDNYILVSKVTMVLGHSILVESFKALEALEVSKCNVVHFTLRNYLLEQNMAVPNPDHLEPLIQLCQEANIPICGSLPTRGALLKKPKRACASSKKTDISKLIMWAHLSKDEISTVLLMSSEDPSLFYVTHEKFSPLLTKLEKDIITHLENNPKRMDISEMTAHTICLAKYEDRWNRAKLCEVSSETSTDDVITFPVQFLDYGDVAYLPATDIAHCPDKFISALPFQAIKCELAGLNPLDGEWSDDVGDVLYDMTQITEDDGTRVFKPLSLIVVGVKEEGCHTKSGKHYKVVLIDNSSGTDVILNKEMVSQGYANWNSLEKQLLDNINTASFQPVVVNDEDEEVSDSTFVEFDRIDSSSDVPSNPENNDSENATEISDTKLIEMLENFDIQLSSDKDSPLNFFANLKKKVMTKVGKISNDTTTVPIKEALKRNQSQASVDSENDADISEAEDSRTANVALAEFHLKSGFFTPKTGWLQTDLVVIVRIMIPGVEKYSLVWSSRHFDFSTTYDGKRYRLYVDLFGSIVSDQFYHFCRGQYVELKMLKVLTDFKWPQLLYDEQDKPIWLQVLDEPDQEMKEDDYLETKINLGEISTQHYKKEPSKFEGKVWHYDKDDDNESDISEEFVEPEHNYDPYDPLA